MKKWAIGNTNPKNDENFDIIRTFWTEEEATANLDNYGDGTLEVRVVEVDYSIEDFEKDWRNGTFDEGWIADRLWNALNDGEKEAFINDTVPYYF